jgi:hypothetical protein
MKSRPPLPEMAPENVTLPAPGRVKVLALLSNVPLNVRVLPEFAAVIEMFWYNVELIAHVAITDVFLVPRVQFAPSSSGLPLMLNPVALMAKLPTLDRVPLTMLL